MITPEAQTLFWFGATIAGIAILSGRFFHWHLADQLVAVAVLAGVGWLLFRTGDSFESFLPKRGRNRLERGWADS